MYLHGLTGASHCVLVGTDEKVGSIQTHPGINACPKGVKLHGSAPRKQIIISGYPDFGAMQRFCTMVLLHWMDKIYNHCVNPAIKDCHSIYFKPPRLNNRFALNLQEATGKPKTISIAAIIIYCAPA
jgi:hypothetical protein